VLTWDQQRGSVHGDAIHKGEGIEEGTGSFQETGVHGFAEKVCSKNDAPRAAARPYSNGEEGRRQTINH